MAHQVSLLRLLAVMIGGGILVACSSDPDRTTNAANPSGTGDETSRDASSDGGVAVVDDAECRTRCEARSTSCKVPAKQIGPLCGSLCDGSLTAESLECIEALDCSAGLDELSACQKSNATPPASRPPSSAGGSCTCGDAANYCAGSDVCGGHETLGCLMLTKTSGVCTRRCAGASDATCSSGTSCADAGKYPSGAERGFWCL